MRAHFLSLTLLSLTWGAGLRAELPRPHFEPETIDDGVQIGYGLALEDVDGDHRIDIVMADKTQIVWYRNPDWKRFVLCENLTKEDNVCVAARDLDHDGKADIAVGAGWNPGNTVDSGSVHFLVPPDDRAARWKVIDLPPEPTVHRMRWVFGGDLVPHLVVAPLHGRGNRNAQGAGVRTLAYRKPANPELPWKTEVVDDTLHVLHNLDVVQWDGDLEEEVLLAGREAVLLADRQPDGTWKTLPVASASLPGHEDFVGAGEVRAGRSRDGLRLVATVEPFHGDKVVVYRQTVPGKVDGGWARQVLDDGFRHGHALACADLLGLGGDQIVAGWRFPDAEGKVGIKLFIPRDGAGKAWTSLLLDDNTMACEDLQVADLDRDGRLDIVASGRATKNLKIYWNRGFKS